MLNLFRKSREEKPSFAILYPEIMTVIEKKISARNRHLRINSRISPAEKSMAEIAIITILLFFHVEEVISSSEGSPSTIEAGFDFVCEIDGVKLFRKPK